MEGRDEGHKRRKKWMRGKWKEGPGRGKKEARVEERRQGIMEEGRLG